MMSDYLKIRFKSLEENEKMKYQVQYLLRLVTTTAAEWRKTESYAK